MAEAVRIHQQEMELPTYVLGPDSPYPTYRWSGRGVYPYSLKSDISLDSRPVKHQAVVLENAFVRVVVLPDLGGKIFSLHDKVAGQDAFMVPPSIKYQDISVRGAWIAGGIELNFGAPGHTVHTVSTVTWSMQKDEDGGASVWVGSIIRPVEERYAVRIRLRPERAALDLEIHTMGPQMNRGLMYWWTNSAVQVSPESRFFYYGEWATPGGTRHSWPMVDGLDFRWYRNRITAGDTFLQDARRDYMAFYDFGRHHGVVNTANRIQAPGQKYFTWGNDPCGRYWDQMLSDSEQTYVEVQRGRLVTQMVTEPIPAMSDDMWTETWMPLNNLGGFSGVDGDIALAVETDKAGKTATIRLLAARPMAKVRFEAYSGLTLLESWTAARMQPGEPESRQIALKAGRACDGVKGFDSAGKCITTWQEYAFKDADWTADPEPAFNEKTASLEELFLQAERVRFYSWPQYDAVAIGLVEKVLQKDPGHSGALKAQAEIALFGAQFALAEEKLRLALKRKANDPATETLMGWALFQQGKLDDAAEHFLIASRYQPGRHDGLIGAATTYLKAGQIDSAFSALDGLMAEMPRDKWARILRVIGLRKSGKAPAAKKLLGELIAEDPIWSRLHSEALLLGMPSPLGGNRRIGDDAVTAALPYIEMGLWDDAQAVLRVDESNEPFSPAIRLSHLAFVQHKLGQRAAVKATLRKLAAATPAQATPWAMTSLAVLEEMCTLYPDQAMLHLLYGNILASRGRNAEANLQWQAALEHGMENTVLFFDLAACAIHKGDMQTGLKNYRRSWELSDNNLQSYLGLDVFLARLNREKEREKLYASLPAKMKLRPAIRARHVNMLLACSQYEEAIEQLTRHTFLMMEFERTIRLYYLEALMGRACQLFDAGKLDEAAATIAKGFEYPRNMNTGRCSWAIDEVMLHYMLGLIAEAKGDDEAARKHWTDAVLEGSQMGNWNQSYEMLAWLGLGNRPRAMGVAHQAEKFARGEEDVPEALHYWFQPAIMLLTQGFGQLAKGRPDEARAIWEKNLQSHADARWYRVTLDISPKILDRMSRKVTGPMKMK